MKMFEAFITSIVSFVGTNIDDIFIGTLLYSEANSRSQSRSIVIGKYVGIGLLVAISILGAFGLSFVSDEYIGLLGVVPIALGVKEIISYARNKNGKDSELKRKTSSFLLRVVFITVANGADNIGVYIPLFAGYEFWQLLIAVAVFTLMIALWCFLSRRLVDWSILKNILSRYRHIIVPSVYIALGAYILAKGFLW